ncbi:enoyl-CoA hydratase-related protein [Jeotgalibacillus sp. ET6]|uniref:enoyl-CoA hydratase-related protein n=1 Tax=Jeotgalibacillus sp. ET6 TaxID=3037260 RepID=UPI00241892A0|nr:enoyl-CoA hydratase-related protein [Jeotgalibacillus sp. ET6]MDG5473042.1 enoyl-CoA hydratase-related protein [Jeotgalibacillus sp. ET6]
MFETIFYEENHGVATITLNRKDKLNAFTEGMHQELMIALKKAAQEPTVRCLVITGSGKAFSAGEDLDGVTEELDHGEVIRTRYMPVMLQIASLNKPVVAAINGAAAGSGLSLALACDFRLMHEKAKLVQAFIHVGLIPDSANLFYLPKLIGHAKAMELAVFGEKITAQEAKESGLVTRVVNDENWEKEVAQFAAMLAQKPTVAVGLIKRLLQKSWGENLQSYLLEESYSQRIAGKSPDHMEGLAAFKEKRTPDFKGE